ncbi:MAG TPA: ATP-binding protein [Verrucomicrobiae bacterium]|nr:ATP-binding protein [Verrucomicrobiae bacterium]
MRIFKSIQWRLQLWYGMILVLVLAGFGFTAYQLERNQQLSQFDMQLQRRFGAVAEARRPHPPRGPGRPPFDRPPSGGIPEDGPPMGTPLGPERPYVPAQTLPLFDSTEAHNFFYVIYGRDGGELEESTNAPGCIPERVPADGIFTLEKSPIRILTHSVPSGEALSIGGAITPELQILKATEITLTAVGGVILFLGLAGGWWISSRAIRPVESISATAVKIAAGDLSQRINVAEVESELGRLAAVLNSTFGRLESAFAQQKQFASDAAHELRTPVSVILTQTQTALGRDRAANEYKQTIEACQRAAQRMRKLIGALLELARLDAGQDLMKRLPCDLSKTVAECVELVLPLAEKRGIKFRVDAPSLEFNGDADRLGLVVTNLLSNAIEYNREGGEVRIVVRRDGNLVVLTVSDTGRGISNEDLPRIFERFYRADKSRASGNAGLGLAISKAIVAAHGGTIEAASAEHAGAVFTVRLPG